MLEAAAEPPICVVRVGPEYWRPFTRGQQIASRRRRLATAGTQAQVQVRIRRGIGIGGASAQAGASPRRWRQCSVLYQFVRFAAGKMFGNE
jgi:hypothetical protein